MIWSIFIISLGLAVAREYVEPEYLEALRESGQDEEFAKLMGVDVSLVRPAENEGRSADEVPFTHVSPLGDIMLSEDQERSAINWDRWPTYKWPNRKMPYVIPQNEFTQENEKKIRDVISELNSRVRNVQMVPRTNENDYVMFINGNGCWSYFGKEGGQQMLSLQQDGCFGIGTIFHEILHTAGFQHEHNRLDRDEYVAVLWFNIPENWHSSYQQLKSPSWVDVGTYDYDSVMHYGWWSWHDGKWKDAFAVPDGIDKYRLGQRGGMTDEDARKLDILYA